LAKLGKSKPSVGMRNLWRIISGVMLKSRMAKMGRRRVRNRDMSARCTVTTGV
jgi:hypothetical protein